MMVDCEDVGELKEYFGCKIERNVEERWIKISQPMTVPKS